MENHRREGEMLVLEYTSRHPPLVVRFFGRRLAAENSCQLDQGIMFGAQPDTRRGIMAPCHTGNRYQCLEHGGANEVVRADAVLLPHRNDSIAFATSDCGAAVFSAEDTGDVVLVHPGRNQLMNREMPTARMSIVEPVINTLVRRGANPQNIGVLLLGQIKPEHFPHKGHPDEALLWQQAQLWGEDIIGDKNGVTLDLGRLLKNQMRFYGADLKRVIRFNHDPFTSPDLSSKRGGKSGSNVVVIKRL